MRRLAQYSALPVPSRNANRSISSQRARRPARSELLPPGLPARAAAVADLELLRHELRTPLAGMLGLAELLAGLDLPGKAAGWLATLQACGLQMASLIDRSLRPEAPRQPVAQCVTVNGLALLESLVTAHWPAALAGGTRLVLIFHPEVLGGWRTDPVALRQALDNLLANAIRFSRNGLVVLEAGLVRQTGLPGSMLELAVENSPGTAAASGSDPRDRECDLEFADRAYLMSSRGHGLVVVRQACQHLGGALQHQHGETGESRYSLVLPGVAACPATMPRPFRPALLDRLGCILLLESVDQRAVCAALACLEIRCEVIDEAQLPEPRCWPLNWVLVASQSLLPARLRQPGATTADTSVWMLSKLQDGGGQELYHQALPGQMLLADLQNALLRCVVLQGLASSRCPDAQE